MENEKAKDDSREGGGKKWRNGGDRDTRERVGNREGEWLRVI